MGYDTTFEECPHCQAVWGIEEIDFQECDSCGYPHFDEDDENWGRSDDDDFDEDEEPLYDDWSDEEIERFEEEDFPDGSLDY